MTPIDLADTIEGVYVHTGTDLELLGIASAQEHPSDGKTLVVYDTPVQLYRYPLKAGDSWTSVGVSRNAMLKGLSYAGTDTYQIAVDDAGILYLPSLTFTQAFRVQMTTTVVPAAGESAVTRQDSFLAECFGEIARATSQTNETQDNFTTAAEIPTSRPARELTCLDGMRGRRASTSGKTRRRATWSSGSRARWSSGRAGRCSRRS